MNLTDISKFRLINQQIVTSKFKTAKGIVGWMGALQAMEKNMLKRSLIIVVLCLFAISTVKSQSKKTVNPDSKRDTFFPLMAWDYVNDEKTLKDMQECGINLIAFVPAFLLDACHKHNIKAIVFDERITGAFDAPFDSKKANKNLPDLIKKVNKHPAVYGYHLKDEPGPDQFLELSKSVALLKDLAPGKWPYINLLPTQSYGEAYDSYLEQFATVCNPTAFSYDNYSQDYAINGGVKSLFWKNLVQVREASLKHGLPFWNIILTAAHFSYPELTISDLRLQMYGSLVYGAKGLSFYKFISASLPILDAPDLGNFRMAPLDQFGERTSTWDILRNINRQIQNIGPTLLKLRSDDVYHIGVIPEKHHGASDKTLVKDVPGGEFIVGDFTHEDGSKYVMIVNKSITTSFPCNPIFNILPKKLQVVSSWNGKLKKYPTPWYWLAPGQGVLLRIE